MRKLPFFVCLFLAGKLFGQVKSPVDSVHYLLDTTIAIMQKKALYADRVAWSALSQELKQKTAGISSVKEAGFAFTRLYNELNDAHGAFFYGDTVFRSTGKIKNVHKINAVTNQELSKGPKLVAQMLPPKIAYLRIPFIGVQDTAAVAAYTNRINNSLLNLLQQNPKGLIIDLRVNQGGNLYPMIGGLRSLFTEGPVGDSYTYEFGDNTPNSVLFRKDSLITGYYNIKLHRFAIYTQLPVAVLIGPSTASAAECTAAALTFRKRTVLIGEESMGLTNGNDGFQLTPDAGFNLAVGVLKNGKGQRLDKAIMPDIVVEGGDNFTALTEDKKVQRAIAWIQTKK